MNDTAWCDVLRTAAKCVEAREYMAAGNTLYLNRKHYSPSQFQCARELDALVDGMKRYGGAPASEFMNKVNRILRNHGDEGLFVKGRQAGVRTMMVDLETHTPFANTGRDACDQMVKDFTSLLNSTINTDAKAMAQLVNADFSNIERRIVAATTPAMNKTQYVQHLEAELVTAKVAEANEIEAAARKAKLDAYLKLASATTALLNKIAAPDNTPLTALAFHRFELKALAAEFGYRIVLVGDRTQAVLVQQ